MCGRYTLIETKESLESWFKAVIKEFEGYSEGKQIESNFNVAPTNRMPVVGENKNGDRTIRLFRWGLLPFWAKEMSVGYKMINARAESLDTKRSFSKSFRQFRCLVPASGFYEWKGKKGNKVPYYIHPTKEPMFAFAGIYNVWTSPAGEKIPTYSIITTEPNKKMADLHNRMPAILIKEEYDEWLNPGNNDTNTLKQLLRPYPDDAMDFYQVSQAVNNVRNNSKDLIQPIK